MMNQESTILAMLDQLPTLAEVLSRQSQPPVCLYNYYIVLRDRLDMEILLDFWLDVSQAEILYKRYLRHARQNSSAPSTPIPQCSPDSPKSFMTQMDMIEVLERIYMRYIVPHAEKEIHQLPLLIKQPIVDYFHQTAHDKGLLIDNPTVLYRDAKDFVYQLLQTTFPLFLQYKVLMNMTLPQQVGRVGVGLFLLLSGFSFEFSLIFLDIQPWQKRLWGLLPILLGVFCLMTSMVGIDPVWAVVLNLSETVPFQLNTVVQPQVKKILRKRSLFVSFCILFITLFIMIAFCLPAGRRL
ncbi:Protein rax1 [Choanephora cucurbitarum]|uniref:Protein rax1 n=1 Tax=Choanephora cucurbitarum TaxID=101091 RepID=A0A1C7N5N4_9FUNG|nr:Protein rax1 [Choanephora cucurbitarum]